MQTLLCFLGLLLIICIRLLHRYIYDQIFEPVATSCVDALTPNVDDIAHERRPLLKGIQSSNTSTGNELLPTTYTCRRRVVCSAAALAYMAATVLAMKSSESVDGSGNDVAPLNDPRFMFGRGGMFVAAIITIIRAIGDNSATTSREIQADGVTLFALPLILRLIKTPGATEANEVLDLLVEPILGIGSNNQLYNDYFGLEFDPCLKLFLRVALNGNILIVAHDVKLVLEPGELAPYETRKVVETAVKSLFSIH
ncbi:hypothetical protein C8R43DRAFT_1194670 [Mycena crocata]|nr:hypothetical protein C8R43DRAFT_1194670 [Mycena crocata]